MAVLEGNAAKLTTCTTLYPVFPTPLHITFVYNRRKCHADNRTKCHTWVSKGLPRFSLRLLISVFLGHGALMIRLFIIWPGPEVPPHFSLQAFEWCWWFPPLLLFLFPFQISSLSGNDVLPLCMCNCMWTKCLRFIERLSCTPYVLSYMKFLRNRRTCYELKHYPIHWVVVLLALVKQPTPSVTDNTLVDSSGAPTFYHCIKFPLHMEYSTLRGSSTLYSVLVVLRTKKE